MGKSPKRIKTKISYNKELKEEFGEIIITVKEARKLLGKKESKKLSSEDLARLIGTMHKIANDLIDEYVVPKNEMGGII